jgi:MPBQ/MSBQ methyltransferase
MDALKMDFPDNTFDIVWACESGEHMPDKKRYVEEMARVLKPGGRIVIATWCQVRFAYKQFCCSLTPRLI